MEITLKPGYNLEKILEEIETVVLPKRKYVILVDNGNNQGLISEYLPLVSEIKNLYDIFVVFNKVIPKTRKEVDAIYALGVHGVLFYNSSPLNTRSVSILRYAADVFMGGPVFYRVDTHNGTIAVRRIKGEIDLLVGVGVIPVLPEPLCQEKKLRRYILGRLEKSKINTAWLRYITLLGESPKHYGLGDYFRSRYLMELAHLRYKLRVKIVQQSNDSSGP